MSLSGGGTAGLTIASRRPRRHTRRRSSGRLVVRAGQQQPDRDSLPTPPTIWAESPLAQPAAGLAGRSTTPCRTGFQGVQALYPSGHTLGGGSTRNLSVVSARLNSDPTRMVPMPVVGELELSIRPLLALFPKRACNSRRRPPKRASNSTPQYDPSAFSPQVRCPLQVVGYPSSPVPRPRGGQGMEAIGIHPRPMAWAMAISSAGRGLPIPSMPAKGGARPESSFLRDAIIANILGISRSTPTHPGQQNRLHAHRLCHRRGRREHRCRQRQLSPFTINANKKFILSSGSFSVAPAASHGVGRRTRSDAAANGIPRSWPIVRRGERPPPSPSPARSVALPC